MESTTTWVITIAILAAVILFDLGVAVIRRNKATSMLEASFWTIFYIATALVFGALLPHWASDQGQKEFFAGWLTEYALSVDNIFVSSLSWQVLRFKKRHSS